MNGLQTCCGEFIRIILFVLNFIFWVAGGTILGVGIYVRVSVGKLDDVNVSENTLNTSAYILIGLGCIVFLVGLLGCCGALTQQRFMLLLYFGLVTLIFLGEICMAIAIYAKKDSVNTSLSGAYKDCMGKFNETGKDVCTDTINTFQSVLKCCGEENSTDWRNYTGFKESPPKSCCEHKDKDKCTYKNAFNEGCFTKIDKFVSSNAKYIAIGCLVIAAIELLGMCFACYLRTYILKREKYEAYTV